MTRLSPERDNVRLALTWFDEHGDVEALLRLSMLLYGLVCSRFAARGAGSGSTEP